MKKIVVLVTLFCSVVVFAQTDQIGDTLIISTDGRAKMIITDPNGQQIGSQGFEYHPATGTTQLSLRHDGQDVVFTDPTPGQYRVSIKSQYSEQSGFSITTYGANYDYVNIDTQVWTDAAQDTVYVFNYNPQGDTVIDSSAFVTPNPFVNMIDDQTRLLWEPVDNAASYRIFSKYFDYPYYSELGQTASLLFDTGVSWTEESNDPLYPDNVHYFVVLAVFNDGSHSLLSRPVSNDDMDNDGYNDFREAVLGTDPLESDTDGDGLNDFEEVNRYYTDPLDSDTDGDEFSDGQEVASDTIPFNDISYPGRVDDCENTGDWEVVDDCQVRVDTTVDGNITVHPQALLTVKEMVTLWFDYTKNRIMVLFGGGIKLEDGAVIKQSQ